MPATICDRAEFADALLGVLESAYEFRGASDNDAPANLESWWPASEREGPTVTAISYDARDRAGVPVVFTLFLDSEACSALLITKTDS